MSSEREIIVAQQPKGHPDPSTTFTVRPLQTPPPSSASPGHLLLRLKAVSVDPYLRGVLSRTKVGDVLESWCVAEVVDSQLDGYSKGELVTAVMPWRTVQEHSGKGKGEGFHQLTKLQPPKGVPITAYLGVLGMPGRTAYFGLLDHEVGRFQPGQTVLVSGAAGAVGSLVGQLAKLKGAGKVIGTAGGPDKCRLVKDKYGFDECLDYKALDTTELMTAALKKAAPEGVHLFFDNTGGVVLQASLEVLVHFGRISLCGGISGYNQQPGENLIPNPFGLKFIYGSINIRAFLVHDFQERFGEFYAEVPQLVQEGKIKFDETRYSGFDKIPEAFAGLFHGHNTGKAVVMLE